MKSVSEMWLLWILLIFSETGESSLGKSSLVCVHGKKSVKNGTVLDGYLTDEDGHKYPSTSWEKKSDGTFVVCKCVVRPCFRKCCLEGQAHSSNTSSRCMHITKQYQELGKRRPTVHGEDLRPILHGNDTESFYKHFDIVYGKPCPGDMVRADDDELEQFHLLHNGKLRAWNGAEFHDVFGYCYELVMDRNALTPIVCAPLVSGPPVKFVVYTVCMLISVPFLAATFIIYTMLPSLHTVHGRSLMSHNLSLLTAYVGMPIAYAVHGRIHVMCMSTAFIIYFAFLASFFWLNVMCLDIWWTFSGFRPMRGSVKEREHKKFIIYSLYCWGSPLIMLIICMVMDLHRDIPDTYVKPGFGELKCWFKSNLGNFIYFSGPIAILIICNIVLFILTAVKIRQVKRGTKILKKQDSRRHNEEEENNAQRFNLYLKLFLVMGVNWIMEIVSFAAGGPDEYWYITDIANTLQGVLIFIIFVWKDRIRKLLAERFCPGRLANTNSLANSSSTRTTGIRHNGSVMSSGRPSFKNNDYQMKTLTSPSARSDDSDVA